MRLVKPYQHNITHNKSGHIYLHFGSVGGRIKLNGKKKKLVNITIVYIQSLFLGNFVLIVKLASSVFFPQIEVELYLAFCALFSLGWKSCIGQKSYDSCSY